MLSRSTISSRREVSGWARSFFGVGRQKPAQRPEREASPFEQARLPQSTPANDAE